MHLFGYKWTIQEVYLTITVLILIITNIITLVKYIGLKRGNKIDNISESDKTQKAIRTLIATTIIIMIIITIIVILLNIHKILFWLGIMLS